MNSPKLHNSKNILIFPGTTLVGIEILNSLRFIPGFTIFGAGIEKPKENQLNYDDYFLISRLDSPSFEQELKKILIDNKIDVLYPANDISISALSKIELEETCVISHPQEVVNISSSKIKTHELLEHLGLVPGRFRETPFAADFPVFIKPDIGHSSIGAELVQSRKEFEIILNNSNNFWQTYLVTEALTGIEVTVDCFTTKEDGLIYSRARTRDQTNMGVSCDSQDFESSDLFAISESLSSLLPFNGPWFFQAKQDQSGSFKVMEIAARIAGASGIRRCQGVNLPQLSILSADKQKVSIYPSCFPMRLKTSEVSSSVYSNVIFDNLYVDFDDTLICHNRINEKLISLIHYVKSLNKKVVLISRHRGDLAERIESLGLVSTFDEVIHITDGKSKSDFMPDQAFAILIDDSFSERMSVSERKNILAVDPSTVSLLKGLFS